MRVVLAGLVKAGTFQAGICSTEGLVGRGAKKKKQKQKPLRWYSTK